MAASVTRDVEALIDLFMSPTFDPFESESPAVSTDDEDDGGGYEAAADSDSDDDIKEEEYRLPQPAIHYGHSTVRFGQILAKMGDEFFHSYTPSRTSSKTVYGLCTIIFSQDTDPDAERKKQEAWEDFKGILNNAVSDNVTGDAFKLLGALLLSLRGLSDMASGIKGLAHSFFIRYIREKELDVEMQRLGGL
ncbi:unnamed protein product, partial [Candidula unifasciata]